MKTNIEKDIAPPGEVNEDKNAFFENLSKSHIDCRTKDENRNVNMHFQACHKFRQKCKNRFPNCKSKARKISLAQPTNIQNKSNYIIDERAPKMHFQTKSEQKVKIDGRWNLQ